MFGPWIEVFTFLKGLLPSKVSFKRPHFNFIILHYTYIITCALIGSIILYPSRNMSYTNALFFGAGAATQSGLNPLNVNDLYLYQQVTLMLMACITNPIFINSFVVFVRLYWFEKRFQTVVLEAQKLRRTRERSRTKTEIDEEKDIGEIPTEEERGIGNHRMHILRPGKRTIAKAESPSDDDLETGNESESSQSKSKEDGTARPNEDDAHLQTAIDDGHDNEDEDDGTNKPFTRDIKFADEPKAPRERRQSELMRLPLSRTADEHIQFVQKQRNNEDTDVLYIPGPRDFDRGDKPQTIQWAGDEPVASPSKTKTGESDRFATLSEAATRTEEPNELNGDDHPSRDSMPRADTSTSLSAAVFGRAKDRLRSRIRHRESNDDTVEKDSSGPVKHRMTSHEAFGRRGRTSTFASFLTTRDDDQEQHMPYLSYQPTIGRNSMFVNLTEEQREELGGIEYRSLKLLATVLCCYFVGFHILGLLSYLPWILNSGTYKAVLEPDGVDPGWWGVFTPASMLNDLGFTLTPDSMSSFQYATWILLMGSFLIIIGNTGFPCMLRFIVWIMASVTPAGTAVWEELRFLLDHPRRCFTLLFPGKATWWLVWVLVLLNVIDLIFFIILDLNDPTVTTLPGGTRVLNGWFQAASTRTAGFNVVNLADLHPAIQVSYLIMMYISVFPIAISVRRTNVYEERSLGIYAADQTPDAEGKDQSYVGAHLRRQLSFDLWFVFLGLFIISIVEGDRIANNTGDETAFSLFAILFEIVSAYGTVGLSLGYPNTDTSFSAQFRTISKLVIIAMQIRGRHRGLPYALDKAVLLPSENLQHKEAEEAMRRASLRRNTVSTIPEERPGQPEPARPRGDTAASRGSGLSRLLSQALSAGPTFTKRRD